MNVWTGAWDWNCLCTTEKFNITSIVGTNTIMRIGVDTSSRTAVGGVIQTGISVQGVDIEYVFWSIIPAGIIYNNQYQIVMSVIVEVVVEIKGVPSLGANQVTFINQCGFAEECVICVVGKTIGASMCQI